MSSHPTALLPGQGSPPPPGPMGAGLHVPGTGTHGHGHRRAAEMGAGPLQVLRGGGQEHRGVDAPV